MATHGRRWFTAFYVYVHHDFIASVIASSTTPTRLLRQSQTASAVSAIVRLTTAVEAFSASLLSHMA
jgi:hypothetical protein